MAKIVTILPVTIAELASRTGRSRQWINKLVNRERVPGVRRGKTDELIIENRSRLDRWIFDAKLRAAGLTKTLRKVMKDKESKDYGQTALLIDLLFGLEENYPDIWYAFSNLRIGEALKILRADPKFTKFKNHPLFQWFCSGRTQRVQALRQDIAVYSFNPSASQFRSLADIARKHGVTRAATSKAYRQMMSLSKDLANARGRSNKVRKMKSVAVQQHWQDRRQAA